MSLMVFVSRFIKAENFVLYVRLLLVNHMGAVV